MSNITFNYFSIYCIVVYLHFLYLLYFHDIVLGTDGSNYIFPLHFLLLVYCVLVFYSYVTLSFNISGTKMIGMKEVLCLLCQYLKKFPQPILEISRLQNGTSGFKLYCPLVFSYVTLLYMVGFFSICFTTISLDVLWILYCSVFYQA